LKAPEPPLWRVEIGVEMTERKALTRLKRHTKNLAEVAEGG
jgi:hypothetical protein